MKIKKCRNCYTNKFQKLFSFGRLSFTGKFPKKNKIIKKAPLEMIMCKKCKLVQLAHTFDLKYLYGPDYGYRTNISKTMVDHVKKVSTTLTKIARIKKNDHVMDIASNDGTLLNFYKKGIITLGIDPVINKFQKEYRKIDYKISNFFSFNEVRKKTSKKFKIISALSVFYDSEHPNKFLQDIEKLLTEDGVFLLEFADLASIIKKNMFDTICHEHLEYYSTKIILKLAKQNSLKVFDIKSNDINGASKQFFICKKDAFYKTNIKVINNYIREENKLKLEKKETYFKFIKKINLIKYKLNNVIKNERKKNKSFHCYGASTKGNVLLQYFKLNNKHIDYVAERNQKKYNLYTPGTKIKIISEKNSRKLLPDYYLVLPWHFKSEILKREKKTIRKGSKFIFPLPSMTINY